MPQQQLKALSEIMSQRVVPLNAGETVAEARDAVRELGLHHFPVYLRSHVVGMICACDLLEASVDEVLSRVMRPAVTLPIDRSGADAAMLMRAADVGSLLVVDGTGKPCGIVTRGHLNHDGQSPGLNGDGRCECCGDSEELRRFRERSLCFSCRDRAGDPETALAWVENY